MSLVLDKILNGAPQWRDRPGRNSIPMERWGQDHWALLVLIDVRATDHHGLVDWNKLTLSRKNWPMLWAARNPYATAPAKDAADEYGLRVRTSDGGQMTLLNCCEGDALMDLVEAGLVTIDMPPVSPTGRSYLRPDGHALSDPSPQDLLTGRTEGSLMPWARFGLTPHGRELASAVRQHRAEGGAYRTFEPPQIGS